METLIKVPQGAEGVAYADEHFRAFAGLALPAGSSSLSWSVVPEDFAPQLAVRTGSRRLLDGGLRADEGPVTALRELLREHFWRSDDAVVVLVHTMLRAHDRLLGWSPVRISTVDDRALCILDRETRSPVDVAAALRKFFGQYLVGLLGYSRHSAYDPHHSLEWPRIVLEETMASWSLAVVSAFDAESFIAVEKLGPSN